LPAERVLLGGFRKRLEAPFADAVFGKGDLRIFEILLEGYLRTEKLLLLLG
jgi:hypothetical protein